jgi:hypothetical protein
VGTWKDKEKSSIIKNKENHIEKGKALVKQMEGIIKGQDFEDQVNLIKACY